MHTTQDEISRRESRQLSLGDDTATPEVATTPTRLDELPKLDLRQFGQETPSVDRGVGTEEGEGRFGEGTSVSVTSPTGSDEDRRLSAKSRDLEWENEWELAQQVCGFNPLGYPSKP